MKRKPRQPRPAPRAGARHTPGNWRYRIHLPHGSADGYFVIEAGTLKDPVRVACLDGPAFSEEELANARLLAAAPKLLEACEQAMRFVGWFRSATAKGQINWADNAEASRQRAAGQDPGELYGQLQKAFYDATRPEESCTPNT
jgi:hypothetical protein